MISLSPWLQLTEKAFFPHIEKQPSVMLESDECLHDFCLYVLMAQFCQHKSKPCQKCNTCHQIQQKSVPDIHWIDLDQSAQMMDKIRLMIDATYTHPSTLNTKTFIIKHADRLSISAANALLKTLEEPPKHTRFWLLVKPHHRLPQTIQSRCFVLQKKQPTDAQIQDYWLASISQQAWQKALEFSGNCPSTSHRWLTNNQISLVERYHQLLNKSDTRLKEVSESTSQDIALWFEVVFITLMKKMRGRPNSSMFDAYRRCIKQWLRLMRYRSECTGLSDKQLAQNLFLTYQLSCQEQ